MNLPYGIDISYKKKIFILALLVMRQEKAKGKKKL